MSTIGASRDAGGDQDPVPARDAVSRLGVADGDDQCERGQKGAPDRAPSSIVDQLEEKEVRQQQHEEARVAVDEVG